MKVSFVLKPQSFNLWPFLKPSVKNGPSVSFGTNVPSNCDITNGNNKNDNTNDNIT